MTIAVTLLTCNRPAERANYAFATLEALDKHLIPGEDVWLHIADDGSSQTYRDTLFAMAYRLGRSKWADRVSISNSEGRGYGASFNASTQVTHLQADLVLPLEDDWVLQRPLDLRPIADVVRAGVFGCVRMGYIGYTQDLRGKFVSHGGLQWLLLDPDSPEPHVWAGHPRLEHVSWQRRIGSWLEGVDPGTTEFEVAKRVESREPVAWPIDIILPSGGVFAHIGTEQSRDDQRSNDRVLA